jgi:ADP-ribose pyrophosphatase
VITKKQIDKFVKALKGVLAAKEAPESVDVKIRSQEIVFKGKLVQVRLDKIVEPGGHEASREIVVHPGAVCIVARPTPDEVLLIRQYRHATRSILLEIPPAV